jgi:hypothetical protein
MKITALEDIDLFGTIYRRGEQLDLTEEAASRLLRDRKASITAAEVMAHIRGKRFVAYSTARDMKITRS